MDYLDFGDNIDYNKYNALVYLLRKFKKLTSNLTLGAYRLESDYGTFNFSDGFVPVGNNWILEDNVTVTGSNVLLNSFYTFVFTVVDVNTSGVVNKRLIRVTSESTGETGNLSLLIPSDLINNDEVILPIFDLEVVFDEHEYYTPLPDTNFSLSVDKRIIEAGEVATITGLLTDSTSTPIENVSLPLIVDGTPVTVITDSTGEFNYVYTGTGTRGKVLVSALGESVFFYDGLINIMCATVTGNKVSLGLGLSNTWLITTGDVVIDWGDGTSDTVNNPNVPLSHTYADGLNEHLIIFDGTVTSLEYRCFYNCSGLTSIVIPDSVTSLGYSCFYGCSGLTSVVIPSSVTSLVDYCFRGCSGLTTVTIPDSVTSIGDSCFYGCSGLIDYELYWETQPIQYNSQKMPVHTGTVFRIPYGTTSIYTDAGYPSARLVEREPTEPLDTTLSIASDKQTIYTDETIIITGTLLDEDNNPVKQASVKLYDGNTLLDTLTTDNNGAYTKTITGLTTGTHTLHTSFEGTSNYNASASSNIIITVSEPTYNLVLSSDTPIIQKESTATINALLTHNGSAYSNQSLSYTVKHGTTTIDTGTVTTGSDGTASISYTGTGVGDVTIEIDYSTLLQETFVIEDTIAYSDCTNNSIENIIDVPSNVKNSTYEFSATGWKYGNVSTYTNMLLQSSISLSKPTSLSLKLIENSGDGLSFNIGKSGNDWIYLSIQHGELIYNGNRLKAPVMGAEYTVKVFSDKIEIYENDTLLYTDNITLTEWYVALGTGTNRYVRIKDFKIKALDNYNLVLSSTTPIIQAGDSAIVTAILTNNDVTVNGETLNYQVKHGNTVISSGTKTTDSSGQATISYVGTGVGNVSVEVTYGTLLQETFVVFDTLFYDSGITGTTATWSNWIGYEPKLVRNNEYCSMTIDTDKTNARMYKQFDTNNNDICIEFDVKQVTSSATNIWATLRNNSVAPLGNVDMTRFSGIGGAINEWVHFKFVVTPINVKVYVNNNSNPYTYNASGVTRIYFQIDSNTSELDYKNFMIYSI